MADTVMMHTRIDRELKREAEQILAGIGMTTSEAIRLFLHRVRVERALPLQLTYESPSSPKNWLDLAGTAPYPLAGMDAQAEVSNEREASANARDQRRNTHQQIIEELAQRRELGQAFKPPSDMSVTQVLGQVREEAA